MKSITKVTVISAVELTKKQVDLIVSSIEKKQNVSVDLKQVVDPSVIAGIKITIAAEEFDATVIEKLKKLQNQMKKNI